MTNYSSWWEAYNMTNGDCYKCIYCNKILPLTNKCDCAFRHEEEPMYNPCKDIEVGEAKMKASDTQVGGGHYKDMVIEPSEFSQKNGLNWCESNVVKYVCRHKSKNGVEDIDKAIHYLQLLKEWEYGG